jgi:malate dehydrogenase (oxaloacetate-decarboxylating)(NADP+)
MSTKEDALRYHKEGRPGKIEVVWTKPVASQLDLSLAYSPGVAEPCREIVREPDLVDTYTARRNLVGVISNGTAVLGLGDIGPRAAKPVMEGKGVLFKRFADIDVFDIEIDEKDPHRLIEIVASLEPTFGGINLEDIRAPECFIVERELRRRMSIPVFHDDQHGTAIISAAAFLNACELLGKDITKVAITCIGAGAAATSCMAMWVQLGVPRENITMVDVGGVIHMDRPDLDEFRAAFARPKSDPRRTLREAIRGADVLIGLSAGGLVDEAMLESMNARPIIFALANPDPEISYERAQKARPDAIIATGRSDFPNQVNNVLGFPYIFRGALDVRARGVSEEMKVAAARALAELARQDVPDDVLRAYGRQSLTFGPEYIIPKPFDSRVLHWVAPAVAEAAIQSGMARDRIDIDAYRDALYRKLSPARRVLWNVTAFARSQPKRIVYPEGDHGNIIRAARRVLDAGIAFPVLLGDRAEIEAAAQEAGVSLSGISLIEPRKSEELPKYAARYHELRHRKGLTFHGALRELKNFRTSYAMMMLRQGDVDGVVAGATQDYPATIRPALRIIGVRSDVKYACGMYMVVTKKSVTFLADTTINIDPDAEALAEIAILAAERVQGFGIVPRVAMLSFSNFGDAPHPESRKVAEATKMVKSLRPGLMIDGEMQANVALEPKDRENYPWSTLEGPANVLIFPNLDAGNAAYKLLAAAGGAEVVGPILLGVRQPVSVLQQNATVDAIVHMTAITVSQVGCLPGESSLPPPSLKDPGFRSAE